VASATAERLSVLGPSSIMRPAKGIAFGVFKSKSVSASQLAERFKKISGVVAVSPNYRRKASALPNDALFSYQWGLRNTGQTGGDGLDTNAPAAWDISVGSPDVVVANIDSGAFYAHEDLAANIWTNPADAPNGIDDDGNGWVDDVHGIDVYAGDADPQDEYGHGTHTSGIIAAVGNNGLGVTGVAWKTKIMPLRFLGADGYGEDAGAIECIKYAIDMKSKGVNIVAINASWGGPDDDPVLRDAIDAAGKAGIVFCAAAGNDGVDTDITPYYPASYDLPNIISVGAHDDYGQTLLNYSNYGHTSVDLFAPGFDIYSTIPSFTLGGFLFFDDMESGDGNWTAESPWRITDEMYWSPGNSWSDSPSAEYSNGLDLSLTSRGIDMSPAHGAGAVLEFFASFQVSDTSDDAVFVEASGDGGGTWTPLGYINGEGGADTWYYFCQLVPRELLTDQFRIRFRLQTDDHLTGDGIHIDDIGLSPITGIESGYDFMEGTSMAAPYVTGTIALLAAAAPGDSLTGRIGRVLSTVTPYRPGSSTSDGRLNIGGALASTRQRFQETDSNLSYSGTWVALNPPGNSSYSGSNYRYTSTTGSTVYFGFTGTGFSLIAKTSNTSGKAWVSIDGGTRTLVDLYSAGTLYQQRVWSSQPLSYQSHTVKIECSGQKNGASTGYSVNVDALDITGGALTPLTRPTVDAGADASLDEGSTFLQAGGISEPGAHTWTVTVNYGDGGAAANLPVAGGTFTLSHVYAREGSYTATVTATDELGRTGTDTVNLTVANVAPTFDAGVDAGVNEGSAFTRAGSFTDPGTDTWTGSVDYGDGSGAQAFTCTSARTFTLSHVYGNEGAYPVQVTITDNSGASASHSFQVNVANVAPAVEAGPAAVARRGAAFSGSGSFVDPGSDSWTATVDYGDGSGLQALALAGKTFALSHTYADIGDYTVTVTVSDGKDTSSDTREVAVLATTRMEQTDPNLVWSGSWSVGTGPLYSKGSYKYSRYASSITIAFHGRSLDWIARKSATVGTASVSVDGGPAATVNLAGATAYQARVWGTGLLPDGAHLVKITRSTGTLNVDAFDVDGTLLLPSRAEDSSTALVRGGTWTSIYSPSSSGASYKKATVPGATISVPFNGERLYLYAVKGPSMGIAEISLDAGAFEEVDLYRSTAAYKQMVWSSPVALSPGLHVVRVRCKGAAHPGAPATSTAVNVDYVELAGRLVTTTRVEENSPLLAPGYAGAWLPSSNPSYSGGNLRYANTLGSSLTVNFTGFSLSLISKRAATYGKMTITLDGDTAHAASVDLYSATLRVQQNVWSTGVLNPGTHSVIIEWAGTGSAGGRNIAVDALDIIGAIP
jgi:subtilisin family serine protease